MEKVLYFPTINLPNTAWTSKSLLYWRNIHVIVPMEIMEEASYYSDFMKELLTNGLITQEIVEHYDYLQYDISDPILRSIRDNSKSLPGKQQNFLNGYKWKIHNSKFQNQVIETIVENKLAESIADNWYYVEESTAKLMMTYLATSIASQKNLKLTTDKIENINPEHHLGLVNSDRDKIRESILENVLPYPVNPNPAKLIQFKMKYREELANFRRFLEQQILVSSGIDKSENRTEYLNSKIQEINERKMKLISKMEDNKLGKVVSSTIKGLLIDVGITFATGGTIVPAASILKGINEIVTQYNGNPIKENELAYLALIENKLL